MTDAQSALAQVREALAVGPTPGPWSVETVPTSCGVCHKVGPFPGKRPDDPPRHACLYADYPSAGNPADDELMANANFIAACHPEAIRELLAEWDELKADAERLRAECADLRRQLDPMGEYASADELIAEWDELKAENEKLLALERDVLSTLPGVYYMDPPDGGSAPLGEQVRRMAVDAARYRWLRNEASTARKCDPMVCIYPLDEQDLIDGDRLDVAIDAAMGGGNE